MALTLRLPGDRLASTSDAVAGPGTYERDGAVFASLAGVQRTLTAAGDASSRPVLCVTRSAGDGVVVPTVGAIVMGRVTRITATAAYIDIVVCDGVAVPETFTGVLRRENIREAEIDKIVMEETFRPCDIIAAAVVSMGDSRSYFLSTAKPELGVLFATSEAGAPMRPASTTELECTATGKREKRKLAVPAV